MLEQGKSIMEIKEKAGKRNCYVLSVPPPKSHLRQVEECGVKERSLIGEMKVKFDTCFLLAKLILIGSKLTFL